MRVELTLAHDDPSLHALRSAWHAAARRYGGDDAALAREARDMHAALATRDVPPALVDELALVPRIADMLGDAAWPLAAGTRRDLVGALAYFVDNDDLIPDDAGRYGYLDDVLVLRLALDAASQEWKDWNDYRRFRAAYPQFDDVDRTAWQRDREALIERMVKRVHRPRIGTGDDGGYTAAQAGTARFSIR